MKKHVSCFVAFVFIAFASCSKKSGSPINPLVPQFYKSYTVNGLFNIILPKNTDTTIIMPISVTSIGTPEPIAITIDSLPTGVTVTPSTAASISDTTSFSTSFAFHINAIDTGVFPITIVVSPGSSFSSWSVSLDYYKFNLVIIQ